MVGEFLGAASGAKRAFESEPTDHLVGPRRFAERVSTAIRGLIRSLALAESDGKHGKRPFLRFRQGGSKTFGAIVGSPAAQTLLTDADRAAIAAMDGRRFEYHRVGYDHRPMVFRVDGTFAAGGTGCERYWTMRDGRLMIAGDDGRLTMDLTPTADGGWDGAWLMFEKMGIRIEPKA